MRAWTHARTDILRERNIEIVGADPATRYGFTQVPNFILTKKELSVGAKLAYAMLAAERSVRTYLKELETAALLEIEQRRLGKTNLYKLYLTIKGQGKRGS
jgi:hypothetical protein